MKPVYRFTILNSDPKTLKSVKINSSKNRQMNVHALVPQYAEPQEQCFELLRMQNSQSLPGLRPMIPLGRAYSCTMVFLLATVIKKPTPPKNS